MLATSPAIIVDETCKNFQAMGLKTQTTVGGSLVSSYCLVIVHFNAVKKNGR